MAVKNLKSIRQAKGLTQKVLAIRSGVNRGTIAYYETVENINPTHVQLRRLADALGCSADDLVAEEGEQAKHFIFDWRDRHPRYADIDLFQNVPAYVMERDDVQRILKADPRDRRLELLKLWEYLPSEQYRVTLLSLFYGDEDISKEFSAWESLFPSQMAWEVRFCDAKPPMDEDGKKLPPEGGESRPRKRRLASKDAPRVRKVVKRKKVGKKPQVKRKPARR